MELGSISHLQNILAYFYHHRIDFSMSRILYFVCVCVKCFHAADAACSLHKHTPTYMCSMRPDTNGHSQRCTHTYCSCSFIHFRRHPLALLCKMHTLEYSVALDLSHTNILTPYSLLEQTPSEPGPLQGQTSRFLYYTH